MLFFSILDHKSASGQVNINLLANAFKLIVEAAIETPVAITTVLPMSSRH